MKGNRNTAAIAGVLAMLAAGAAPAQQAGTAGEQSAARNLYVGLAFGQSNAKAGCKDLTGCEDRDNTFGALAGYRLTPRFAAELAFTNLGEASASGGTYVRSNAWELDGVGNWPVSGPLSVYGKVGLFRGAQEGGGMRAAQKELITGITYALGAQFDLGRRVGVRLEWQRYPRMGGGPVLPTGDIDVVRLAALWRFQ